VIEDTCGCMDIWHATSRQADAKKAKKEKKKKKWIKV
jgi:hypothetical protein